MPAMKPSNVTFPIRWGRYGERRACIRRKRNVFKNSGAVEPHGKPLRFEGVSQFGAPEILYLNCRCAVRYHGHPCARKGFAQLKYAGGRRIYRGRPHPRK
jgi:hypothetical protein